MSKLERIGRDLVLRPRRQLTLPAEVCEALGLAPGDRLELSITDAGLLLRPRKSVALQALREIQRVFASSGIPEEELQAEGRRARRRLSQRYSGNGG